MNSTLLLLGQSFSLSAKIVGALFLAYVYWKHKRKPALYWSLSWVAAASSIFSDITGNIYLLSLSEAFWAMFLFYGLIVLLEEESIGSKQLRILSTIPPIISIYGILLGSLDYSSDWFVVLGLPYAVSALFIMFSGAIITYVRKIYNHRALYLGGVLLIYGFHELDFPMMRRVDWFAPIGFTLGAIFSIVSAYVMIKFVFAEEFIKPEKPSVKTYIHPGVLLISPTQYSSMKDELKDIPVLAFVRDSKIPKTWNTFFVSTVEVRNSISPTNLAFIIDTSVRYLKEAKNKGFGGAIIIDCPEYLKAYNGFESLAKFFASLKDFTILFGGTLILVIEKEAWNERELQILKRILA
ncbi:MAG TPA: DUF835 domain-containing protein [Thermococcaceae archaeon]|uniref:DUF835 domain-containing protein n=1 Tax=Thermococcus sibiricus TaxID=172049 RepID=A0A101EN17_9EURY|nr:DUF835 domain-containing protein [Thermococcus sibiricus]KUK18154.1 MAG: Uncharacterized protein XD54_0542 [Thermococcus sibiricus]KUK29196.1 MAG: Uncharacterized protein XD61_0197 [Thermococcus sp. 40_45]HII68116.1 DUF835 domain-containing protein [Thermococcaceae archaeon]